MSATRTYTTREICPISGIWAENNSGSKIAISQGQLFPFHLDKKVFWKLYKDVEQLRKEQGERCDNSIQV